MESYIIRMWNEGEIKQQGNVFGWLFDSGEFRPLMKDAMNELWNADLVSMKQVIATEIANQESTEKALEQYIINQSKRTPEQIAEERFEARAAMGSGVEMINILTGEHYRT